MYEAAVACSERATRARDILYIMMNIISEPLLTKVV